MEIDHNHCQDRSELDHHLEHLKKRISLFQLQEFIQQDQMACAADGQPFCDPLHNTEYNGL